MVIYAGSHGEPNGLDNVIRAARVLEERNLKGQIEICLLGDGPEKVNLVQLAKRLNVSMVQFLDAVPKDQVYHQLVKADICLMILQDLSAFQWGISPNKLYDYFALAKPIIFAVNSVNNPVKENHAGITIPPSSPTALADAIEKFLYMSIDERKAMGLRGRQFLEDHHSLDTASIKLENFLQDLILDYKGFGAINA